MILCHALWLSRVCVYALHVAKGLSQRITHSHRVGFEGGGRDSHGTEVDGADGVRKWLMATEYTAVGRVATGWHLRATTTNRERCACGG
jgi:hypothetical protein